MRTTCRLASAAAVILASVVASLLLVARPAAACSCMTISDADSMAHADAVFTGTLTSRTDAPAIDGRTSTADPARLEFEVDAVYKGAIADSQVVETGPGALCGGNFTYLRTRYVVFARRASSRAWR